ncbi:hypothetical protein [Cellulomonas bogoriensis]|uniref:Uncharacterized protein n=2 Tax=Cellulomonas bogoriensis TaxID=301388 RepID=A0A0A0BPL7_9CELL|nr:hypothetical protein N869_05880 [Cellulomonas bogoriensis 69B4 = DSM 16987]
MAAFPVMMTGALGAVMGVDLADSRRVAGVTEDVRGVGLPAPMELDLGLEACTMWDGVLCGWADGPAGEAAGAVAARLRDAGTGMGAVSCGAQVAGQTSSSWSAPDCAAQGPDLRRRGEAHLEVTASDTVPGLGVPRGRTLVTVRWSAAALEPRHRERLALPAWSAAEFGDVGVGLVDVAPALPERWGDLPDESFAGIALYTGDLDVEGLGDDVDAVVAALVLEMTAHGFEVTGGSVEGGVDVVGSRLLDRWAGPHVVVGATVTADGVEGRVRIL